MYDYYDPETRKKILHKFESVGVAVEDGKTSA